MERNAFIALCNFFISGVEIDAFMVCEGFFKDLFDFWEMQLFHNISLIFQEIWKRKEFFLVKYVENY